MNRGRGRDSMRLNYETGGLWCWGQMAEGMYDYREGGGDIDGRVINELLRCKDTIAFSIDG